MLLISSSKLEDFCTFILQLLLPLIAKVLERCSKSLQFFHQLRNQLARQNLLTKRKFQSLKQSSKKSKKPRKPRKLPRRKQRKKLKLSSLLQAKSQRKRRKKRRKMRAQVSKIFSTLSLFHWTSNL